MTSSVDGLLPSRYAFALSAFSVPLSSALVPRAIVVCVPEVNYPPPTPFGR